MTLRRVRRNAAAPPPQDPCTAAASADPSDDFGPEWARASDADRDRARMRLAAVQRAEALVAAGAGVVAADRLAASEAGVAMPSVRRWRTQVAGLAEGARVAALLDRPRSGRPTSIAGSVRTELEALVLARGAHLTADHAHDVLRARHGQAPSVRHLRRWLSRWRREHAAEYSAVVNPDRHRSHRMPAFGHGAAGVQRLNQLWELDSTLADILFQDGRRRALVAAIDIWSRRTRFLVCETSRASAIAALLRRCMLDWGVPEAVRTDEGRDYTSRHVTGVLADLEIAIDLCTPYRPDQKPYVERVIGTASRDLFANLPGFAGHSVADAEALRSRKSFARRRGKDAAQVLESTLEPDDLQARLDTWCDAVYARRPHAGLDGLSPFDRATSWTGQIRRVRDARALDALLAEPAGGGGRTVGKKGLRVDGGIYIAAELGPLVGERVKVRLDPTDLGRVYVYEADGPFVCIAEDPLRTGLDRAEVAARARAKASESDRSARARARELIRRHRPEAAMDDVLAHAEKQAGKVVALPRPGTTHETPGLTAAAKAAAATAETKDDATPRPVRKRRVMAAWRHYLEEED